MAIELEDGEVIREAEHVAALIEGTATTRFMGATKVISVRLPILQIAELEAFANQSGRSRNAMVALLLDVAFEEVRAGLKAKTLKAIEAQKNVKISEEMAAFNGEAH